MILVAYRHGFRASEIVDLEWSAIDFVRAEMHVRRAKNGKPATHPIRGDELRELRKLRRESAGSFVFTSERGGPFTTARPHAQTFGRLQARWRRSRYAVNPGLFGSPRYSTHGALYGAFAQAVPRFLARLKIGMARVV